MTKRPSQICRLEGSTDLFVQKLNSGLAFLEMRAFLSQMPECVHPEKILSTVSPFDGRFSGAGSLSSSTIGAAAEATPISSMSMAPTPRSIRSWITVGRSSGAVVVPVVVASFCQFVLSSAVPDGGTAESASPAARVVGCWGSSAKNDSSGPCTSTVTYRGKAQTS